MRRTLHYLPMVCLIAAALCLPLAAAAQDLSRSEIREFKKLSAEGADAYQAKDYEAAVEKLRAARAIYAHPDLDYNIGRSLLQLERCREAREAFDRYAARDDLSDDERIAVQDQLAFVEHCREDGTLEIACTVREGDAPPVSLDAVGPGSKHASLVASATVTLNGEPVACGDTLTREEGTYTMLASADGYEDWNGEAVVPPAETGRVTVEFVEVPVIEPPPPEPKTDWRPIAGYSAIGGGAALIVGGFIMDASSAGRRTKLADASAAGDIDEVERLQGAAKGAKAATIGLYVAGVVAASAGVAILLTRPSESETALVIQPGGLAIKQRF